jgi:hypothetical protein
MVVEGLEALGFSSICNVLAAVKVAKALRLGSHQALITVATDGAAMYRSERQRVLARDFPSGFDDAAAAATFERHVLGASAEHVLVLDERERRRIFNLGYFTWVEQLGLPLEAFVARRSQDFWAGLRQALPAWDRLIDDFNRRTGLDADG